MLGPDGRHHLLGTAHLNAHRLAMSARRRQAPAGRQDPGSGQISVTLRSGNVDGHTFPAPDVTSGGDTSSQEQTGSMGGSDQRTCHRLFLDVVDAGQSRERG